MDNFRWIMLGIGLAVILLIYLFGRRSHGAERREFIEPLSADEMPHLSTADNSLDDDQKASTKSDEIPFVPSEINEFELNQELVEQVSASVDDGLVDVITSGSQVKTKSIQSAEQTQSGDDAEEQVVEDIAETPSAETNEPEEDQPESDYEDDLLVIHVEAKEAYFSGLELLKIINRLQLKFGDMNIYHAYDDAGETMFSMSNMLKPGHFEPEHLSEMRTPGVILFAQLSMVNDPVQVLERMLHTAQAMAQELSGQLTTAKRMRLQDSDLESFKRKADYFSHSSLA